MTRVRVLRSFNARVTQTFEIDVEDQEAFGVLMRVEPEEADAIVCESDPDSEEFATDDSDFDLDLRYEEGQ